jgi:hypothetical protein
MSGGDITLKDIQEQYNECQQMWLKSNAYAVLESELAEMRGKSNIGNVVCLGLGSFCERDPKRRPLFQLAGLMTIISHLRKLVFKTYQATC